MKRLTCLLIAILSSCASPDKVCEPGRQLECTCPGGAKSSQACLSDGSGWSECDCPCEKDCSGRECGPDPVCAESCGDCGDNSTCNDQGKCECIYVICYNLCCGDGEVCINGSCCLPDCTGRSCGEDPACGTSCGTCSSSEVCTSSGMCCTQDCSGRECGNDPICGMSCGSCDGTTEYCGADGNCADDCDGRVCGPSPIHGFDCGTCPGLTDYCTLEGQCLDDCEGIECGSSPNAGHNCAECNSPEICIENVCVDIGLEWIQIDGGRFMMGTESAQGNERPSHTVEVPTFMLNRTEVTVSQYQQCVNVGVCAEPYEVDDCEYCQKCNWGIPTTSDNPINCLTWQQASDFCVWAGGRLPSESEWEYAARSAGQENVFPWGDEPPTCDYAVMWEDWPNGSTGCGWERTRPVCSISAGNTAQGLCDMAGNAEEWVQDEYHADYNGAPTDGSAWEDSLGSGRVLRGGSWLTGYWMMMRTRTRRGGDPEIRTDSYGFRCAK